MSTLPSSKRFKVAVIHGTDMACFREVIRGINTFASQKEVWQLDLVSPIDQFIDYLRQYRPDGLLLGPINSHDDRVIACDLVKNCVSAIGQHSPLGVRRIPEVESDDVAVGVMAAKHFFEKGFSSFAFLGTDAVWSRARWKGFQEAVRSFGHEPAFRQHNEVISTSNRGWERPHYGGEIIAWLESLPKPVAILACNDLRGSELVALCRQANLKVPDDLAIMGVDNDDLECELTAPPLSSVSIPWREAGYRSASLLSDLLDGKTVAPIQYLVPPTAVIERQSTNTLAIEDEDVRAAVRFIRDNAHERIGVEDILRKVPTARRSLEKRFRSILGRSPLDEIRRVHVERAKLLLSTTDLAMPDIAEKSGFASASWFSKAFSDITGEAPVDYRRRTRQSRRGNTPSQ